MKFVLVVLGVSTSWGCYQQRRRPGPTMRRRINRAALPLGASRAVLAPVGGFGSALLAKCPHRAGAPYRETVMSTVQRTSDTFITMLTAGLGQAAGTVRVGTTAPPTYGSDSQVEAIADPAAPGARAVRPPVIVCATRGSAQPAVGRLRLNGARQCGHLTITASGASVARPVIHGSSLRYPSGN